MGKYRKLEAVPTEGDRKRIKHEMKRLTIAMKAKGHSLPNEVHLIGYRGSVRAWCEACNVTGTSYRGVLKGRAVTEPCRKETHVL